MVRKMNIYAPEPLEEDLCQTELTQSKYGGGLYEHLAQETYNWLTQHPDPLTVFRTAIELLTANSSEPLKRHLQEMVETRQIMQSVFHEIQPSRAPLGLCELLRGLDYDETGSLLKKTLSREMLVYEIQYEAMDNIGELLGEVAPHLSVDEWSPVGDALKQRILSEINRSGNAEPVSELIDGIRAVEFFRIGGWSPSWDAFNTIYTTDAPESKYKEEELRAAVANLWRELAMPLYNILNGLMGEIPEGIQKELIEYLSDVEDL